MSELIDIQARKLNGYLDRMYASIQKRVKEKGETRSSAILLHSHAAWKHFIDGGGKRIRPVIALAVAKAFGAKETDEIYNAVLSLELIHNSTLVHDDWMDEDTWRRGVLTVHEQCRTHYTAKTESRYFKDAAMNKAITEATCIGNLLCSEGYDLLLQSPFPKAKEALHEVLQMYTTVNEGQILDCQDNLSKEDYITMISKKTGAFIVCAARVGAYLANQDRKTVDRVSYVFEPASLAFQVTDDLLDLEPSREEKQYSDIRNGKENILVAVFRERAAPDQLKRFNASFGNRSATKKELDIGASLLKETKTVEEVTALRDKLYQESVERLEETTLVDKSVIKELLTTLALREK